MNHIRTIQQTTKRGLVILHMFEGGGHDYKVEERISGDGGRRFSPKVYFQRETKNVFGNRSIGVFQSGWRSLPNGPKNRELMREAEVISLRQRLSPPKK